MIVGSVTQREGKIRLEIAGRRGKSREVEATVDSGFTSFLTLPRELVASLGLRWKIKSEALLADGSQTTLDTYVAKVIWDGIEREIEVNAVEAPPLVGMRLLEGYELKIEVREAGRVTIKRLGRRRPPK
jgi:clan AA aspartic protease